MVSIKNKFDSARLHSLYEKVDEKHALLAVNTDLVKNNCDRKIKRFEKKQNHKLQAIAFAFADIEKETDSRMADRMRKFNTKDYWYRREAIQTWRKTRDQDPKAFEKYEARLHALDEKKYEKEAKIRAGIKASLAKKICTDPVQIEEKKKLYLEEKDKADKKTEEFRSKSQGLCNAKLQKLQQKAETKEKKYAAKIQKLEAAVSKSNHMEQLGNDVLLKLDHLTMQFGGLKAVDDLSIEVKKGEIFGLIGPNGAGKTTVFNCITQFYKPTKGKVYFKDRTGETILLNNYPVHDVIKHGIVRTFQNVELIKEVSVLDNLLIGGHVQYRSSLAAQFLHLPILRKEEIAVRKKALEVLEFMGLSLYKDMLAWGLPYGVLKKIEIARTLMNNPQLIILDEPAAGLNDSETADLAKLIQKIRETYNCTILLVEHDMGLVMDICDTVCAISFGKLLGIGTTEEIQANPKVQEAYLGSSEDEV